MKDSPRSTIGSPLSVHIEILRLVDGVEIQGHPFELFNSKMEGKDVILGSTSNETTRVAEIYIPGPIDQDAASLARYIQD